MIKNLYAYFIKKYLIFTKKNIYISIISFSFLNVSFNILILFFKDNESAFISLIMAIFLNFFLYYFFKIIEISIINFSKLFFTSLIFRFFEYKLFILLTILYSDISVSILYPISIILILFFKNTLLFLLFKKD